MALCDFDDRVRVYVGYGNRVTVVPYSDIRTNLRTDMTEATEVRVCIGAVTASSSDDPPYVWWEQDTDDDSLWRIHFKPGLFTGVPTGEQDAAIIVFSDTYPDGLVLTNSFPLLIESAC
jgi:hypothetical protein